MYSFNYLLLIILGCTLATWLSRVLPFILLKRFDLPDALVEYLQFVPIVIMSALWFTSIFTPKIGHLPTLNMEHFLASIPTVISAIISKNLFVIVIVGILSLACLQLIF